MTGADESGMQAVVGSKPTRMDGHSPGIDELTGLGAEAERNGAIIALSKKCRWSAGRLSRLFGLSERHVFRIIADFDESFGDVAR